MSDSAIGIFDSGLGGLTAVKELVKVLPNENIVYFGDTARVPYGSRSKRTIVRYAEQDATFLLSKGVKMIIAACGTVSSVATDLKNTLPVPFTGVVEPTAQAAVNATRNGTIGVIGTSATVNSCSYQKAILAKNKLIDNGIVVVLDIVKINQLDAILRVDKPVIEGLSHIVVPNDRVNILDNSKDFSIRIVFPVDFADCRGKPIDSNARGRVQINILQRLIVVANAHKLNGCRDLYSCILVEDCHSDASQ